MKNYFFKCFNLNKIFTTSKNFNNSVLRAYSNKVFLADKYAKFTFTNLDTLSKSLSNEILTSLNTKDLNGAKIGVYCSSNYTYLTSLLAIWRANGVPVCLSKLYPLNYLEYFLNDSNCKLVINGHAETETPSDIINVSLNEKKIYNYNLNESSFYKTIISDELPSEEDNCSYLKLSSFVRDKEALILYTSGTSGPPKGVVLTFKNIIRSMEMMRDAWQWSSSDCMLATLPLNHYSGIGKALNCLEYGHYHLNKIFFVLNRFSLLFVDALFC